MAGLYGEIASRDIFENLCGLLLLKKYNTINTKKIRLKDIEKPFFVVEENDGYKENKIDLDKVYHVQTRRGDGGLDILIENENEWTVYQCKNYILGKIDKDNRPKQIEDSFNRALETAKKTARF